ncbi:coagulation factor XIII B chain-like [Penaeus vannamei]|uniref:coagulation factor XIII B chain-like n=1 Tax=Penaeus vannamei TaxID=6689 RepID=UPI00387F399C
MKIKWNDYVSNTAVLKRANITSVEAMIMKHRQDGLAMWCVWRTQDYQRKFSSHQRVTGTSGEEKSKWARTSLKRKEEPAWQLNDSNGQKEQINQSHVPRFICLGDPNVTNSYVIDYDSNSSYVINTTFTAMCLDGHLLDAENDSQAVVCTPDGWSDTWPCLPSCTGDPPEAGDNMARSEITDRTFGSQVFYNCTDGYLIPETFPNVTDLWTLTCEDYNWTAVYPELRCDRLCLDEPPLAPEPGNTTWDFVNRTAGYEMELFCPEGHFFPNVTNTTTVRCDTNGNWTDLDPEFLNCRILALEDPRTPNNSFLLGPQPPYWENTTVVFACFENSLFPSGRNYTWATFNGTDWLYADPDAACIKSCPLPFTPAPAVRQSFLVSPIEGATVTYYCSGGFEGDETNFTNTCLDGNWTMDSLPVCKMCDEPPPPVPSGVSRNYTGNNEWGTSALYLCETGLFPDGGILINVTCDQGNWTQDSVPPCARKDSKGFSI